MFFYLFKNQSIPLFMLSKYVVVNSLNVNKVC